MSKSRAKPEIATTASLDDIKIRTAIAHDVTPKLHAALVSLDRYALSRRIQHLLTLGLEHEEQAPQAAAIAEHANLSAELIRRLLSIDEIRGARPSYGAAGGDSPNPLGNPTNKVDAQLTEDADAIRRNKIALKLASQ